MPRENPPGHGQNAQTWIQTSRQPVKYGSGRRKLAEVGMGTQGRSLPPYWPIQKGSQHDAFHVTAEHIVVLEPTQLPVELGLFLAPPALGAFSQ